MNEPLNFKAASQLKSWLETQPIGVSAAVAVRTGMRGIPLFRYRYTRADPVYHSVTDRISGCYAIFWAMAVARMKLMFPDKELPSIIPAFSAVWPFSMAIASAVSSVGAASVPAAAADACAAIEEIWPLLQGELIRPEITSDLWRALSKDATALRDGLSIPEVVGAPLWHDEPPNWLDDAIAGFHRTFPAGHWEPWRQWLQRRLDGVEDREEIELLFVTLPADPKKNDPAVQNARLAEEIARLSRA